MRGRPVCRSYEALRAVELIGWTLANGGVLSKLNAMDGIRVHDLSCEPLYGARPPGVSLLFLADEPARRTLAGDTIYRGWLQHPSEHDIQDPVVTDEAGLRDRPTGRMVPHRSRTDRHELAVIAELLEPQ
jgi:hypothetical protein